jgi:hypothetical protein
MCLIEIRDVKHPEEEVYYKVMIRGGRGYSSIFYPSTSHSEYLIGKEYHAMHETHGFHAFTSLFEALKYFLVLGDRPETNKAILRCELSNRVQVGSQQYSHFFIDGAVKGDTMTLLEEVSPEEIFLMTPTVLGSLREVVNAAETYLTVAVNEAKKYNFKKEYHEKSGT